MSTRATEFPRGAILATRFTGTLSQRSGDSVELLQAPGDLERWLELNGLRVTACSSSELSAAVTLREAIHRCGTAVATSGELPTADVELVNTASDSGHPRLHLLEDGHSEWRLRESADVDDALAVIARDAIELLAGSRSGRLAVCSNPDCRAVFLDSSRGQNRRWCNMNTCGNKEKKARLRNRPGRDG